MFGNALDMLGHIDSTFNSNVGAVFLIKPTAGDYSGEGGLWIEAPPERIQLTSFNIQPAKWRDVQLILEMGGTANVSDVRVVHINDGINYLYPDDSGKFADLLEFSDGLDVRQWRVVSCDNRPWRNFCRAVVERYMGTG